MLEAKNLKKTYKTKGGVEVHALDDVSVTFPEKGMVFLLGKSGSGKSTLLNVLGGLDHADSGEIIIKGRNSKEFSGADFDSYRNTFIGFIFQEYNILNEFNLEQNISLALQLQGKPNDKAAVESYLEQVDLKGMGRRKPNTLSGGQKQRVAIARALIKNPEIIMADEPTGALDSNTGKQVFDTLKKLSESKLIIVVSHDRDFAEIYGDRVIELADGKIISDVTKKHVEAVKVSNNVSYVNNSVLIKEGSKLTKEELNSVYDLIKNSDGEVIISKGEKNVSLVKQVSRIKEDNSSDEFDKTGEVKTTQYDGSQTKFIRSHLPFARAFKMGVSSLKTKPVRLVFSTFLTSVSLIMFGVASTLLFFDSSSSSDAVKALADGLRNVFLGIGITFAVFASLMLFNFISSSIASKTKEIGILRAVGARGSDLFKIFFSESGVVTLVCLAIGIGCTIPIVNKINSDFEKEAAEKLLTFGFPSIATMIGLSIVIAFIGTFIPVLLASRKAPVESIRSVE